MLIIPLLGIERSRSGTADGVGRRRYNDLREPPGTLRPTVTHDHVER
jgi:hypothetical protein